MQFVKIPLCYLGLLSVLCLAGCAPVPPPITEVEGVVLLNDKPLPGAFVEFVPELTRFGAEMNSSGTTDEQGRFQLTCTFKRQPGAAVAKHWVLVTEPAMPDELRGMDAEAQQRQADYLRGLTNRPIPPEYGSVGTTPLRIDVSKETKSYVLKLVPSPEGRR